MTPSGNTAVEQRATANANNIQDDYLTSADAPPRYGYEVPLASGKGEKIRESTQPTSVRPIVPALTFEKLDWKQPDPTENNIPTADALEITDVCHA